MRPQYLMARVPGNDESEFVLQRAFVPRGGSAGSSTDRPELTGIMMARSDPENYGQLIMVRLPGGEVDAPGLVHSEIRKSEDLTEFIKEKAGARVEFGEMSIVLLDDTIVYVRPVYVEANSATAVPELQRVVAVNGDRIFMGRSIDEAIEGILDSATGTRSTDETSETEDDAEDEPASEPSSDADDPDGPATSDTFDPEGASVVDLIARAESLLAEAEEAERNGFEPQAADLREQAREALLAAQRLLSG